ncbi:hypothetical protein [Microvirga massiliensis]|uniref:hypothetical protein n=1 Tax=Microvirga massiliensis TaxID=1033741 RepID=UPI0011C98666|nr:hypothetical protein [Microvirga massiliensis]
MTSLRVAFVTMPKLYADIMWASLARCAAIDVIGIIEDRESLEADLRHLAPDVIFLGLDREESDVVARAALWICPKSQVIGLTADGRHATLHFLWPQCVSLEEADPNLIASAILDRWLHPAD